MTLDAPQITYLVQLPGGPERLRQLVLYVAKKCRDARYFGSTKLNKIIWRADFDSFAARRVPVTGRRYQRLPFGPAPLEMAPLLAEMKQEGFIEIREQLQGNLPEKRTIALIEPQLAYFTKADLSFVDNAIKYYWEKTGTEASDDSHGIAWKTRVDGELIPYELAHLSDKQLPEGQKQHILEIGRSLGWGFSR